MQARGEYCNESYIRTNLIKQLSFSHTFHLKSSSGILKTIVFQKLFIVGLDVPVK